MTETKESAPTFEGPSQRESGVAIAERRAHSRQLVQSLAYVELGDGNGGVVLNVSEDGMAVQAMMSVYDDDLPCVRLQLAHSKKGFEARARVVWSDDHRKLVGLKFIDLTEETRQLIREWIAQENHGISALTVSPTSKNDRAVWRKIAPEVESPALPAVAPEEPRLRDGNLQIPATRFPNALKAFPSSPSRAPHAPDSNPDLRALRRWSGVLGLIALATLVSVGSYEVRVRRHSSSLGKSSPLTPNQLGLKLDWTGTVWRVSWNPDAPTLLKATKAQLLITDGNQRKTVELQTTDLRAGTIVYSPLTNDVSWVLQVSDANRGVISESARTIGSQPSTANTLSEKMQPSEGKASTDGMNGAISGRGLSSHNDTGGSIRNAPSDPGGISKAPVRNDASVVLTKSSQTDAPLPRAEQNKKIFRAAKLVSGRKPEYPATARQDGISGSVELHFKIGSDGRVHDLLAVKGSPVLAEAAMEAVANRKYKPALVNGVTSETEASAVFDFKLN